MNDVTPAAIHESTTPHRRGQEAKVTAQRPKKTPAKKAEWSSKASEFPKKNNVQCYSCGGPHMARDCPKAWPTTSAKKNQ